MPGRGGGCVPLFTGPQMTYASVANLTRRLCTTYVEPSGMVPLISSRLVALGKCPVVRPIVVIHKIAHNDILDTVGTLQLCVGQDASCESSCVHAMRRIFACGCV